MSKPKGTIKQKPRQMILIMCVKMKIPVNENSEDEILAVGQLEQ